MVWTWSTLYILTWTCASHNKGLHFFDIFHKLSETSLVNYFLLANVQRATPACNLFISHLASWLCSDSFREPTFRPSGTTKHWKSTVFRDFPTFSSTCISFLLTFSHFVFFDFLFWLLLCASSVHTVRSWSSKFPPLFCNYRERTKSIPDKVTTSLNNSELFHTSITAQGGRGTSKIGNIYHIGEVGSCDWWIAEGVEGSLEGKLPTKWTEGQALQPGRSSDVEKIRKGEDAGAWKSGEVAKHYVFKLFVAPENRKVGSLKRRVQSQLDRSKMKNCTPLWRKHIWKWKSTRHLS